MIEFVPQMSWVDISTVIVAVAGTIVASICMGAAAVFYATGK